MLGGVGASTLWTNLIIRHGVADILGQIAKLIHVIGAIQEPRELASLFQWDKVSKYIIQFPSKFRVSGQPLSLESVGYRSRVFLLSSSLTSPSGTEALNDSANPSTRGIKDSIVFRHAIVC